MHQKEILLIGGVAAVGLVLVARKTGVNPLTNKPIVKDPLTGKPIVRDPVTGRVLPQPIMRVNQPPTAGGAVWPPGYVPPGGTQPPKQTYFGTPGSVRPPAPTSDNGPGVLSRLGTILGLSGAGLGAALSLQRLLGGRGSSNAPSANRPSQSGGSSGGSGGGSGGGNGSPGGYNRQSPTDATGGSFSQRNPGFVPGSTGYFDEDGNWISAELADQMAANPGGYIDENGEYVPPTDTGINPDAVPTDDMGNPLSVYVEPEDTSGGGMGNEEGFLPGDAPFPDDFGADPSAWDPNMFDYTDPSTRDTDLGSSDPSSGDMFANDYGADPNQWDPSWDDVGRGGGDEWDTYGWDY